MKLKLLFLLLLPVFCLAQEKPVPVSTLEGRVTLQVPADLKPMNDEMWEAKYNKRARPNLVLSDTNGTVNLIVELTKQSVTPAQLVQMKDFQVKFMKQQRPDMVLLSDGEKTINGRKVVYFKMMTQAVDQKVFNYFFITSLDGKVLMSTFNCIERLKEKWEAPAEAIVASMKIN